MAVFTDAQLERVVSELGKKNEILYNFVQKYATNSWAKLQAVVKTGRANEIFSIGDEFICKYNYAGTEYDWTWVCADFRNVTLENGDVVPGMVLQSKYCSIESIVFDSPEQVEADEATAQEGVFYYGLTGDTVQASSITLLNLNAGDAIPYSSYDKVFKSSVYDTSKNICQYGYNRYKFSAVRKWLNSDKAVGEDWFGQLDHVGQVKPTNALTLAGFMAGLDDDFLAVINPTKIQVATNTVTDGGVTDVIYDKFWLPSIEEMFGVPQVEGVEGNYFPYWKNRSGLTTRSNDAVDGRKILPINSTSSQYCRLRSAARSVSCLAWICYSSGTLASSNAHGSCRPAPACVIC